MTGANPARPSDSASTGPWIVKMRYSGATGKHSAQPFRVDDVVIINLGLPPETDPVADGATVDSMEATAFLTEDEMPASRGLDVEFEAFRLVNTPHGWYVVEE